MLRMDVPPMRFTSIGHDPLLELQQRQNLARRVECQNEHRFITPKISALDTRQFATTIANANLPLTTRRQPQVFWPKQPRIKMYIPPYTNTTMVYDWGSRIAPSNVGNSARPHIKPVQREMLQSSKLSIVQQAPKDLNMSFPSQLPMFETRQEYKINPLLQNMPLVLPSRAAPLSGAIEHERQIMPDNIIKSQIALPTRATVQQVEKMQPWTKLTRAHQPNFVHGNFPNTNRHLMTEYCE